MMRRVFTGSVVVALTGLVAACAAAGGPNGGASHLPNRGIVPWTRFVPAEDQPLVAVPAVPADKWHAPAALVVDGQVRLYVEVRSADGSRHVAVVRSDAAGESFGVPTVCLGDEASAPSVARAPDGTFWMAYVDPATDTLAMAQSADGTTFGTSTPTDIEATAPSLILDDDTFVLYATIDARIVRATAGADRQFGAPAVVFEPGTACVDPFGKDKECWDGAAIVDADVRIARTPAGRRVFRMMYAAHDGAGAHVGFAASFDGVRWERYAYNPVLDGTPAAFAPSAVLADDRYLLYYELAEPPVVGVALAIDAPEATADSW